MDVEETDRNRCKYGRFLKKIQDQTFRVLQHNHSYVTGTFTMNCVPYHGKPKFIFKTFSPEENCEMLRLCNTNKFCVMIY